jgi:hypothetical protein
MTEKTTEYQVPGVNGHVVLTELVQDNSNEIYKEMVANTANAMIISGALDTGQFEDEEIIDRAIAFTDKLVEKVGLRS